MAAALREAARDSDIVCRYGGEEFCIVLPHMTFDEELLAAERLRKTISEIEMFDFTITASLGVSSITTGAADPQELLDQSDLAPYAAKDAGRNRCVQWSETLVSMEEKASDPLQNGTGRVDDVAIPFHAVTGLLSALAYRDAETAAHSSRVAESCVAAARGLMSVSDTYVLEMAALLHDIGKIGVPDSILPKT
jgi:HD-GYP domain-containing protein (c-di-GMP phosphodiesterase class II)